MKNGYNLDIQLELTDYCSLHCLFCNFDSRPSHPHRRSFISLDLVKKLLQEVQKNKNRWERITFQLNWSGESLLHPQFEEILSIIIASGVAQKIELHTNGLNWNFKSIRNFLQIINKKVQDIFFQITFSLDSFSEKIYRILRCGGNFKRSLTNFIYLWKMREKFRYRWPCIVWQFIVREENYSELKEKIPQFSRKMGIEKITFLPFSNPLNTGKKEDVIYLCPCFPLEEKHFFYYRKLAQQFGEKISSDALEREFIHRREGKLCLHPWENPVISSRGWLGFCTGDEGFKLFCSNLKKGSFIDLWMGKEIEKKRRLFMSKTTLPEFCKRCLYEN